VSSRPPVNATTRVECRSTNSFQLEGLPLRAGPRLLGNNEKEPSGQAADTGHDSHGAQPQQRERRVTPRSCLFVIPLCCVAAFLSSPRLASPRLSLPLAGLGTGSAKGTEPTRAQHSKGRRERRRKEGGQASAEEGIGMRVHALVRRCMLGVASVRSVRRSQFAACSRRPRRCLPMRLAQTERQHGRRHLVEFHQHHTADAWAFVKSSARVR
jgi:hypothetical protein